MSLTTQTAFATALTADMPAPPPGLEAWHGADVMRRFAVYRNNVTSSLVNGLKVRFPAVEAIVGTDFFEALAQAFIAAHPPRSAVLIDYGTEFAAFVETFEPVASLPYLADICRLEDARVKAYHAADADPLDPKILSRVRPEDLPRLIFEPHPSVTVLASPHPIITIWAMNTGEQSLGPVGPWIGQDVLVVRPQMQVEIHPLPSGAAALLFALCQGAPLGVAAEDAQTQHPDFDLSAALALALQSGAFATIALEGDEDHAQ
jgi:hypothetical protein